MEKPTVGQLMTAMVTLLCAKELAVYAKKQQAQIDTMEIPDTLKPFLSLSLYLPIANLIRHDPVLSQNTELTIKTLMKMIDAETVKPIEEK